MNSFYEALKESESSADERIRKLAAICKTDLEDIRNNQTFEDWEWWFS